MQTVRPSFLHELWNKLLPSKEKAVTVTDFPIDGKDLPANSHANIFQEGHTLNLSSSPLIRSSPSLTYQHAYPVRDTHPFSLSFSFSFACFGIVVVTSSCRERPCLHVTSTCPCGRPYPCLHATSTSDPSDWPEMGSREHSKRPCHLFFTPLMPCSDNK